MKRKGGHLWKDRGREGVWRDGEGASGERGRERERLEREVGKEVVFERERGREGQDVW